MGRATLASVAIHVAAVLAIPALAWTASTAVPIETVSFAHVVRVEIVPPRASHPPPRAVAPRLDPHQHINLASHLRLIAALPHRHASPEPAIATNAPAAPAVASLQRAGTGTASGDAAPSTTPSPEVRAVASVGTHQSGGYLPFGAEQPDPVLDPGIASNSPRWARTSR